MMFQWLCIHASKSLLVIGRIPGSKENHYVNINSYDHHSRKVNATDTSISEIGLVFQSPDR